MAYERHLSRWALYCFSGNGLALGGAICDVISKFPEVQAAEDRENKKAWFIKLTRFLKGI